MEAGSREDQLHMTETAKIGGIKYDAPGEFPC
eukprot:CAMPEP_0194304456 /NCGR_PEP_ID=MMETSP0171-20130528/2221_1 /TAXON_ID=218684 /ORGANISM="Corethron pennatum, Strain L29A3" /LENGTH=31 /DNA_ID= /DNA_START= /DNA_END= /DNA_ORIENTATION=